MPSTQYTYIWSCAQILCILFCYQGWSVWAPKSNFSTCDHYSILSLLLKGIYLAIILFLPHHWIFFPAYWSFPNSTQICFNFSKIFSKLMHVLIFSVIYNHISIHNPIKNHLYSKSPIPFLMFFIEDVLINCFPQLVYWNVIVKHRWPPHCQALYLYWSWQETGHSWSPVPLWQVFLFPLGLQVISRCPLLLSLFAFISSFLWPLNMGGFGFSN